MTALPRSKSSAMAAYLGEREFLARLRGLQLLLDTHGGRDRAVEFVRADGYRYYKTIPGDGTPIALEEARAMTQGGEFYCFKPAFVEVVATVRDETWNARYVRVTSKSRGTVYVRLHQGAEVPRTLEELQAAQEEGYHPSKTPNGWVEVGVIFC